MATTLDRRRVLGPETSQPPVYAPLDPTASTSQIPFAAPAGPPKTFLTTGLISQANGSAYIEVGKVKIACAVYGPRPKQPPFSLLGTLNLEIKFAPFASHPRRAPLRDTEPPHLSHLLTEHLLPTLQLHLLPKSSLDVYLLVLEEEEGDMEGTLAAGLTVAATAVADARIPMNALGVGVVNRGKEGVSSAGRAERKARVTVGCMPALGMLTSVWMTGKMGVDELSDVLESSIQASHADHDKIAKALMAGAHEKRDQVME